MYQVIALSNGRKSKSNIFPSKDLYHLLDRQEKQNPCLNYLSVSRRENSDLFKLSGSGYFKQSKSKKEKETSLPTD